MLSMLFISLFVITFMLLILYVQKYKEIQKKYDLLKDKRFGGDALYFKSRYASMGETVGNIAHQWKQPLNAIGSIQNSIKAALLFRGEISKEKLLSSVETSFKLIQHLAETIDTFYSFLSQQNNKKMNFVVADELEKVRKITEYSFQNSKILLQFDLEVNPTIAGNANEFTHAMLNIILNAKDAFDGGSVSSPKITVHVSEREERCVISICDNAGGIRLDPIDMVFDLHISTKEAGSGLGLFMTKNIVENRFGGKISVANINHGACFTIELPYAENAERFHEITTLDEKITLERINKLSHKVIELEEVEKALKMWADIFKHARWGIAIYVEASQCFEMSNSAFESLYGYTSKEIKELSLSDFFTPETLPFFLVVQEEALKQGYAVLEAVHIRKDGTTFPVLIELIVVKDDKDKALYIISNIWDLSQRKEIEENLLLKEFALNKISEAVFLIDENANFQYVNESACKSLGYSEEELLGMGILDIDFKIKLEEVEDQWQEIRKQKAISLETQHTRKDGTVFPVEISSDYFEYQNVGYNLARVRDISERLEVEKRKEDEKMRLFFERQIVGMAITSPKKGWVQTNDKLCEILGYTHEELSQISWVEMTHPEDRERDLEQFNKLLSGEIDDYTLEKRVIRKDQEMIYVNLVVSCIRQEDGSIDYILALIEDITERKKTQEALAIKEREFRSLSENIPDNIARFDTQGRYLYINPTHEQLLGMTLDEAVGNSIPDTHTEVKAAFTQVIKTAKTVHVQQKLETQNGETRIHDITLTPEFNEKGKLIGVLGIGRDMTDIYRLQDAIATKEEQFRTLVENLPDKVIRYDKAYRAVYVSPLMAEVFGEDTMTMLLNKTPLEAHQNHDYNAEAYQRKLEKVIATGEMEYLSHEMLLPTGEMQYGQIRFVAERDQKGDICGALAIGTDITKLKKAEELYRSSSNLLHSVMESSREVTIFALDREYKYLTFNDLHKNFYKNKYGIEVAIGKSFIELVPDKEFAKGAQNSWDRALSGESFSIATEEELVQNGVSTIEYWNNYISPIFDDAKAIVGLTCFSINITKRREIEMKLESLNSTLEQKVRERTSELQKALDFNNGIINAIPDLMFEVDIEGTYLNVWAKDEKLLAAQKEILLGNKINDVLSEEAAAVAMEAIQEADANGLSFGKILQIDLPDGAHWFELSSSKKADGNIIFISRDVTERKVAQMKIEEEREKFSSIFRLSPAGISISSLDRMVYVDVNESLLNYIGYTREEMIGRGTQELEIFQDPSARLELLKRLEQDGAVSDFEYSYRMKDGHVGQSMMYGTIIMLNGEKCFLAHNYDITERKKIETRFSKIAVAAPGVNYIFEKTLDGAFRFTYLAPTFEELSGVSNEVVLNDFTKSFEMIVPQDRQSVMQSIVSSAENLTILHMEFRIMHHQKGILWVESQSKPEKLPDGTIVWYGFLYYITNRKKDEQNLGLLNKAIDNASDAVYIVKDDHSIYYVSDGACRMLGYTKEEFLAMKIEDIDPLMSTEELSIVRDEVNKKQTLSLETKHRKKNGAIIDVEITGTEFHYDDFSLRLAIVKDISERKKHEDEIVQFSKTLEHKVRELQRAFELNEDIINTLPDLLFEMDERGNYLNIWAQNKELLAQQKEALLGNNIYNVLSKQAADTIIEAFKEADISKLSTGKHIQIDLPEGKKHFELSVSKKSDGNYLILSREVLGR